MDLLIVDDEALQREMIANMVAGWGHTVTAAPDAEHALDLARRRRFDLFILDVFLPDLSSMELIPLIKALQPDACIITLTGASSREVERRLRETGIAYYMAKPFQRQELRTLLTHIDSRLPPGRGDRTPYHPAYRCRSKRDRASETS